MDETLIDLVERFRANDDRAADELFTRYSRQMLALAHRLMVSSPYRAALDPEGAVNSGFRSFFSAIQKPNFDSRTKSIGGLLATIVARKSLVKLRRKYAISYAPEDLGVVREATTALLEADLSEQEVELDLQDKIQALLTDMTKREKQVLEIYLDRDDERSLADVARACRCALTTVEDVIDRFTAALRAELNSDSTVEIEAADAESAADDPANR